MSERRLGEPDSAGPDTDFDSLFVIGEADQTALVAKQQQQVNFVTSRHHQGSGYNSPNRASPARRTQVTYTHLQPFSELKFAQNLPIWVFSWGEMSFFF